MSMLNSSSVARKMLAAGVLAAAVVAAPLATVAYQSPVAHAEGGGVPDPMPVPEPAPAPEHQSVGNPCQFGEVVDQNTGDCIAATTPMESTAGGQVEGSAPRTTQDETTSINTGVPANQVPNINGDPCTGSWESVVCSEEGQTNVVVQPHTSISSSP